MTEAVSSEKELSSVVVALSRVSDVPQQAQILGKFLGEIPINKAADIICTISSNALANLIYAKTLLILLDGQEMEKVVGKKTLQQIQYGLRSSQKANKINAAINKAHALPSRNITLFKAKLAMFLQSLYLLNERIGDEGLPALRIEGADPAAWLLDSPELKDMTFRIDLNNFGKVYWNVYIEILKEADFRPVEEPIYEIRLSETLIKQLSEGSTLVASSKEGVSSRLSDAVIIRMASNIIKRLSLLLRTVKMYESADHPSVNITLESMMSAIEQVLDAKPTLTLTRMGSDLLVEDIKIRQRSKFLDDFITAMDERNINSVTFRRGISMEEAKTFMQIFSETEAQIKKKGGVKKIIETKGVSHIMVDQFRYGIISGDTPEEEDEEVIKPQDRLIESVIFGELVSRIKTGRPIADIKAEEIGSAFKEMISGTFTKDANARRTLAQMIMALDPSLADKALFTDTAIRDDISWSTARKILDELLVELAKGSGEDRIATVGNLEKMGELAITKNKDTTLEVIVEKLSERLSKEHELGVVSSLFETLVNLCRRMILAHKLDLAMNIVRMFQRVDKTMEKIPEEKQTEFTRAMFRMSRASIRQLDHPETIDVLINELESESMTTSEIVIPLLEAIGSEEVVVRLLQTFLNPNRSVRNRSFQILRRIGKKAMEVCIYKLKSIDDAGLFPRSEDEKLIDEAYYIARNCINLIANMGGKSELELLKSLAQDQDPRIRREILSSLMLLDPPTALDLAKLHLADPALEGKEAAIKIFGQLQDNSHIKELVELFVEEPRLRTSIITAFTSIGGEDVEKALLGTTNFAPKGLLKRIYQQDIDLWEQAVKSLGICGRELAKNGLRQFIKRISNPLLRPFFFDIRLLFGARRRLLLKNAKDSLSRVEYRIKVSKKEALQT